jgi:hypothetical protein
MYFSCGSSPLDSPIITLVNIDYLKIHLDKRTENSDFAGVAARKLQYLEMRLLDFRSKT